jgi:hypothetical protein
MGETCLHPLSARVHQGGATLLVIMLALSGVRRCPRLGASGQAAPRALR